MVKGWAGALVDLCRGRYGGRPANGKDEPVQEALRALSGRYPGGGFWKLRHRLRKNRLPVNHKRTRRICRAIGLHLPRRLKKWLSARVKQPLMVPEAANGCWSLDFTGDALTDGRRFRPLNVLDNYNWQLLGVEIDFSLPAARVVQVPARLVERHDRPAQLRPGNGPEFISAQLTKWCEAQAIVLHWIQPGKPTQNACIECFNGSLWREMLDIYLFRTLIHVRQLVGDWLLDYNTLRPR